LPDLPRKLATPRSAAAVLFAALCLAYADDVGRGFIKDDFRWVRETRVSSAADVVRLFQRSDGFYRPVVSLTFALNSATFGLAPRAYGHTNLALIAATAALIGVLATRLGLAAGAAVLAAGVWAFNFHGINMAALWISGRTSPLATFFALLTALAFVSRRTLLAGLCCLLTLLSKEEAILLPLVLAGWSAYDGDGPISQRLFTAARRTWPCFVAVVLYLILRMQTDAFWPSAAPAYYRPTFSPSTLAANILQYADRAITWPAVAALVIVAASRMPAFALRASARQAGFSAAEKRIVAFGALWLVATFAVTVFVPARSSLYAVLPSVGSALAAGALASAALRAAPQRAATAMTVLALMPVLLAPVYWRRNERWVRLADLSTRVVEQLRAVSEQNPGRPLVVVDDPSERFNLDAAFGSLWPDAAALFLPRDATVIVGDDRSASSGTIVLRLQGDRLVQER
jgi:hypothetical protein